MTARKIDENGFILIEDNPISRVGVFPYLGRSIGAPDPQKIYMVFRPEEVLSDPECVESFKLLPIIDDHEMLGSPDAGFTPAEKKGVHGSTGETVYYKDGELRSTLKIFSETMADLIESGKRDLSLGYRCAYEQSSGSFQGKPYEYIQRNMRGNHLALVDEARCDVAVLDHQITFDSLDIKGKDPLMNEEQKPAEKPAGDQTNEALTKRLDDVIAVIEALKPKIEQAVAGTAPVVDTDKPADQPKAEDDEDKAKAEAEQKAAADALNKSIKAVLDDVADIKKQLTGMDKNMLSSIAKRDELAKNLSVHIGSFDHADKTLDEVAKYGVEKLGLDCAKGQEIPVLTGYMAGAKNALPKAKASMDSAVKDGSVIGNYINGKK